MGNSNIIIRSNIYPCKEYLLQDTNYIAAIENYDLLKEISRRLSYSTKNMFSSKQKEIVKTNLRCINSKNDPCWGYAEEEGICCKCVNGDCPRIKLCNPEYREEERRLWEQSELDTESYGLPHKQRKYYLVDLISDKEKAQYISEPGNAGVAHPSIYEEPEPDTPKRKLIIIGYEGTSFNDYEDEQLSPIYGYADEVDEHSFFVMKTAGSYYPSKKSTKEKTSRKNKTAKPEIKPEPVSHYEEKSYSDVNADVIRIVENSVRGKVSGEYTVTDMSLEMISKLSSGKGLVLVFDNPAELAYVSGIMIKLGISHSYYSDKDESSQVILCTGQQLDSALITRNMLVSKSYLDIGSKGERQKSWELIDHKQSIGVISTDGREYREILVNKQKRWICGNLYGATHVVLKPDDLEFIDELPDCEYNAFMEGDDNEREYSLYNADDMSFIGIAGKPFLTLLDKLKEYDEISNDPVQIKDICIRVSGGVINIMGIGHMLFDEY